MPSKIVDKMFKFKITQTEWCMVFVSYLSFMVDSAMEAIFGISSPFHLNLSFEFFSKFSNVQLN